MDNCSPGHMFLHISDDPRLATSKLIDRNYHILGILDHLCMWPLKMRLLKNLCFYFIFTKSKIINKIVKWIFNRDWLNTYDKNFLYANLWCALFWHTFVHSVRLHCTYRRFLCRICTCLQDKSSQQMLGWQTDDMLETSPAEWYDNSLLQTQLKLKHFKIKKIIKIC